MGPLKMTRLLVAAAVIASMSSMMSGAGAAANSEAASSQAARMADDDEGVSWKDAVDFIVAVVREFRLYEAGKGSGIYMDA
jgi:hypothetical protein